MTAIMEIWVIGAKKSKLTIKAFKKFVSMVSVNYKMSFSPQSHLLVEVFARNTVLLWFFKS